MTQIDELARDLRLAGWPRAADALEAQAARVKELERINTVYADRLCAQNNKMNELREARDRIDTLESQLEAFREAAESLPASSPEEEHKTLGPVRTVPVFRFDALMSALAASQHHDGPEVLALRNTEN